MREVSWIRPSLVEGGGLDKMNNTNTFKEIKTLERLFRANDFLVEYGNPCHMVALCGYISYACALHPAKEGSSVFLWVSKGEGYRKIIF